ncbi:Pentatricopeptide repeat-containing protein [Platanthera zijinensis]|uniref:Pentatricopeptide repeat-containing protein n=1 Tax=Platanthera zijinensis TaxID=2320716 RepID=A0AAP0BQV7_9ASPA
MERCHKVLHSRSRRRLTRRRTRFRANAGHWCLRRPLLKFSLVLKACSQDPSLPLGLQVHAFVIKSDLAAELYLNSCLIGFYSRRGRCELTLRVFDRMPQRDSVSWNAMIDGYAKNVRMDAAKNLFGEMKVRDRNLVTWNTMIACYATSPGGIDDARDLFDRMPERDLISWNLITGGYVKSGRIEGAATLFEIMPLKDAISWTNLITGYMEEWTSWFSSTIV